MVVFHSIFTLPWEHGNLTTMCASLICSSFDNSIATPAFCLIFSLTGYSHTNDIFLAPHHSVARYLPID